MTNAAPLAGLEEQGFSFTGYLSVIVRPRIQIVWKQTDPSLTDCDRVEKNDSMKFLMMSKRGLGESAEAWGEGDMTKRYSNGRGAPRLNFSNWP